MVASKPSHPPPLGEAVDAEWSSIPPLPAGVEFIDVLLGPSIQPGVDGPFPPVAPFYPAAGGPVPPSPGSPSAPALDGQTAYDLAAGGYGLPEPGPLSPSPSPIEPYGSAGAGQQPTPVMAHAESAVPYPASALAALPVAAAAGPAGGIDPSGIFPGATGAGPLAGAPPAGAVTAASQPDLLRVEPASVTPAPGVGSTSGPLSPWVAVAPAPVPMLREGAEQRGAALPGGDSSPGPAVAGSPLPPAGSTVQPVLVPSTAALDIGTSVPAPDPAAQAEPSWGGSVPAPPVLSVPRRSGRDEDEDQITPLPGSDPLGRLGASARRLVRFGLAHRPKPRAKRGRALQDEALAVVTRAMWVLFGGAVVMVAGVATLVGFLLGQASVAPAAPEEPKPTPETAPTVALPPKSTLELALTGDREALKRLDAKAPAERSAKEAVAIALGREVILREQLIQLGRRLRATPALLETRETQAELRRYIDDGRTAALALRLLAELDTPVAANLLYDLWTGTPGRTETTRLAEALVYSAEVRPRASAALGVALDLRVARGCEKTRALVQRAQAEGDRRSIRLLHSLRRKTGCGPDEQEDCYPCLRGDDLLKDAIAATLQRHPEEYW